MAKKIGVLGYSFDELGNKVENAFNLHNQEDGLNIFDAFKEVFAKPDSSSQLIDIDTFFPELDDTFDSQYWISQLSDVDIAVQNGTRTWQQYHDSLNEGERWIAQYGQATQGQIRSAEQLTQSYQAQREAALRNNQAIQQQTLSARAATAATKALSIAGNMIAMMAIAKGIELVVTGINDYIHRMDNAQDALEESQQAFEESRSEVEALEIEKIICILVSCQILVYNNKKMSDRLERLI